MSEVASGCGIARQPPRRDRAVKLRAMAAPQKFFELGRRTPYSRLVSRFLGAGRQ
jgi:hypothetical protein